MTGFCCSSDYFFRGSVRFLKNRYELPGEYPVLTMVMVIYHYVEIIGELSLPPIFL